MTDTRRLEVKKVQHAVSISLSDEEIDWEKPKEFDPDWQAMRDSELVFNRHRKELSNVR